MVSLVTVQVALKSHIHVTCFFTAILKIVIGMINFSTIWLQGSHHQQFWHQTPQLLYI